MKLKKKYFFRSAAVGQVSEACPLQGEPRCDTMGMAGDVVAILWLKENSPMDLWLFDSYIGAMSTYSVADAKNNLSDLIDRALRGEGVVITRHGTPVVEIKAVRPAPKPVTREDLAWLDAHRYRPSVPLLQDAGPLVSTMRDEDAH